MSYEKKTITIENETQEKVLKEALKNSKNVKKIMMPDSEGHRREERISEMYELEKMEKQLEK